MIKMHSNSTQKYLKEVSLNQKTPKILQDAKPRLLKPKHKKKGKKLKLPAKKPRPKRQLVLPSNSVWKLRKPSESRSDLPRRPPRQSD